MSEERKEWEPDVCPECGSVDWRSARDLSYTHCGICGHIVPPTPARSEAAGGEELADTVAVGYWRHHELVAAESERNGLVREAARTREMFQRLREALGVTYPTAEEITGAAIAAIAERDKFRASEGALHDVIGEGKNLVASLRQQLAAAREDGERVERMGWSVIRRAQHQALSGERPIDTIRRILAEDRARTEPAREGEGGDALFPFTPHPSTSGEQCEYLTGYSGARQTTCGVRATYRYEADGGSYMHLCDKHGARHADYAERWESGAWRPAIDRLREGGNG